MRQASAIGLIILIAIAVGISFYGLWRGEHRDEIENGRRYGFPVPNGATEIRVYDSDGREVTPPQLRDPRTVAEILDKLKQAPRSYFGDPEPMGALYEVRFLGGSEPSAFKLNDLRPSPSSLGGKIYPRNPGRDEVWQLPSNVISLLVDTAEPAGLTA